MNELLEDSRSMAERHNFNFSQNTFGGSLACNTIATLVACSFADGNIDENNFKKYCRVGSEIWTKVTGGSKTTSAKEIIDSFDFFRDTYKIEEYQGYYKHERDGRISLTDLVTTVQEENDSRAVGLVFTDGCISFAVGKFNQNWVIFDSHSPNAWIQKSTYEDIVKQIRRNLVLPNIFDATTIIMK